MAGIDEYLSQAGSVGGKSFTSTFKGDSMDPLIGSALITGGAQLLTSLIGGALDDSDEIAKANRDAQLKIAADTLGLNYAQLKSQQDQYDRGMAQRIKEFAATNKLDLATLKQRIVEAQNNLKMQQETLQTQKQQFSVTNAQSQAVERRKAELRQAFLGAPTKKKVGAPTNAVQPTANRNLGAQVLTNTPTPTATPSTAPVATA